MVIVIVYFEISVCVDIDAVRLYRAGTASGWHAGVLLATPTIHAEVCSQVWQNSKFNLIIDVTYILGPARGVTFHVSFRFW